MVPTLKLRRSPMINYLKKYFNKKKEKTKYTAIQRKLNKSLRYTDAGVKKAIRDATPKSR